VLPAHRKHFVPSNWRRLGRAGGTLDSELTHQASCGVASTSNVMSRAKIVPFPVHVVAAPTSLSGQILLQIVKSVSNGLRRLYYEYLQSFNEDSWPAVRAGARCVSVVSYQILHPCLADPKIT
jgi:hypothetical protein